MGDMLLQNESNDLMMEQAVDPGFFVDTNSQSLADEEIRCRNQMVNIGRIISCSHRSMYIFLLCRVWKVS